MVVQKFSFQKGGQRKKTLSSLKKKLEEISGGDVSSLLDAFFQSRFGKGILKQMNTSINKRLKKLILNVGKLYEVTENYKKKEVLSLLSPLFSRSELSSIGIDVSKKSFRNANAHAFSEGAGSLVTINRPPSKRPIDDNMKNKIENFWKLGDISRVAPNYSITIKKNNKKKIKKVYYRNHSIKDSFRKFLEKNDLDCGISESSFRNVTKGLKFIKKSKRRTDLCPICEQGKLAEKKLDKMANKDDADALKVTQLL